MQDLRWGNLTYEDEDEWCFIGPGAGRGLLRLLGEPLDLKQMAGGRMANAPWPENKQRRYRPYIAQLVRHVAAADWNAFEAEHNLCEFDKRRRIEEGVSGGRRYRPAQSAGLLF